MPRTSAQKTRSTPKKSDARGLLSRPLEPLPVVTWSAGQMRIIDQTLLPQEYVRLVMRSAEDVWEALRALRIRGAPTIGLAAAYGLCVGLREETGRPTKDFLAKMREVSGYLNSARPTAVNLAWALRRLERVAEENAMLSAPALWRRLLEEGRAIEREEVECNLAIARHGAALMVHPKGSAKAGVRGKSAQAFNILTHCNTGSLATVGIGTALGVILEAARLRPVHVWIDETRPLLQGARLNTWELARYGVAATLICDNMAAMLMAQGRVDAVITGADRIARNGDFANKIGTYSLAVNCKHHGVPFYCAAPLSTFDPETPGGPEIPIEERAAKEVHGFRDLRWAPGETPVYNPAFDVTPAGLVTGHISEAGVAGAPYSKSLKGWIELKRRRP